jgi:tRNA modification GTPase
MIHPAREDTICAIATPPGTGAIAIIRMSGNDSLRICEQVFTPRKHGIKISEAPSHTVHFGNIIWGEELIDEVLVSVFRQPHSYTGENAVEISCHGSVYIQQKIMELLISQGTRTATPGEFTLRAFLNGKFDLSQAEAVADLIAASSRTAHDLALDQMRGGFSKKIGELRSRLLDFASLIELELDFSQEDVEFADRKELVELLEEIKSEIMHLASSFSYGNVLKTGIPVAIIGKPNVGKSTLLNAILNEERAIVSDIPGTTRDTIEDTIVVQNYAFRFIDTAGLRHSRDAIESEGIERTYEKIRQAKIVLYVFDANDLTPWPPLLEERGNNKLILIANKSDLLEETPAHLKELLEEHCIFISAKRKENINLILERLVEEVREMHMQDTAVVSNVRHYEALLGARKSAEAVLAGLSTGLPGDLISVDLRMALYHLGEITGQITTDDILGNIFGRFCIGK